MFVKAKSPSLSMSPRRTRSAASLSPPVNGLFIVLCSEINPVPSLTPTLQATLFEIYPNVPIVASASDISQALTALRLLLGDHRLASDNVECVVIASQGSKPRPRGVGCIQVAEERFPDIQGCQSMLIVKVEQLVADGQRCPRTISKMLIFLHFFPDIHDERER